MHTFPIDGSLPPTFPLTWRDWLAAGRLLLRRTLAEGLDRIERAAERRRERRLLLALDEGVLKDIGRSRADAWGEYAKPCWRD